jgi:hypothetical protein
VEPQEVSDTCEQGKIQSPTTVSANHTVPGTTVHKLQRFDWARDVNDSLSLGPAIFDNGSVDDFLQVCNYLNPADPNPGDETPNPVGVTLTDCTPGDAATDAIRPAFAIAAPAALIDPTPCDVVVHPVPDNPIPGDVSADRVCPALASAVLADLVNASPITTDGYTPPAYVPANHTRVMFANPRPTHSVRANHEPVTHVDTISITPTKPVHVDPVRAYLLCKLLSCIKDMHTHFVRFHFSIFLFLISEYGRVREFWIVNEDVRMFGGGTCDSELCSLHLRE